MLLSLLTLQRLTLYYQKYMDIQPDLLKSNSPADCHARVGRNLNVANANRIYAAPARQHFSVLALLLADDFIQHTAMVKLLERTRNGNDYMNEVIKLSHDFWSANERV
jgi:hypothetical protein